MNAESVRKWKLRRQNKYLRRFLNTYSPEFTWEYPHLLLIQHRLELAIERASQGIDQRLMFFVPPRHGKSSLITERFPAYALHKRPYWKTMIAAFNETKATDFTRKMRRITEASGIKLSPDRAAASEWYTVQEGGAKSAGAQTGAPGYGANILIFDDPVRNRWDANSQLISNKIYDEYGDSFMTRLQTPNIVIVVLTRWSELDLAGRILADEKNTWDVINIPALALENDILGRKPGEALCPDLIPQERLEWFKEKKPMTFESLYQGNPSLASGNIFKREWFRYYDNLEDWDRTVFSVDTAFKEKQDSDYSVIGVWHETAEAGFLDDVIRDRLSYPRLRDTMLSSAERYNPDIIFIEDHASGQSLIQDLQMSTRLPIVPVRADRSKRARAYAATGQYESGNIYHRRNAAYLQEFEAELLAFDSGAHDDQVDMTTQYINNAMNAVPDIIIV